MLLAPYDPAWALRSREVIAQIADAIGLPEQRIQHVGSTAVPGLLAKPVLDIDVGLLRTEDREDIVRRLVRIGFIDRGQREGGTGHLLVWETAPDFRTAHVHITPLDSIWWQQDLAFRDALRTDLLLRRRYADFKWKLARQFPADRKAYREAKDKFIRATIELLMPRQ